MKRRVFLVLGEEATSQELQEDRLVKNPSHILSMVSRKYIEPNL